MKAKSREQGTTPKAGQPFSPRIRMAFLFSLAIAIIFLILGSMFLAYINMKQTTKAIYQSASAQISDKVDESLKLLQSLALLELFYEPNTAWEEKVAKLDQINENYGYMFICYVDEDIVVYTLGEEPASLASREHMQKVYASKQPYVTDSFVAGADGKTLNYTVIVPLLKDGTMTGSLFATIVLDETSALLNEITSPTNAQAILIGSKGQTMCSTNNTEYGASILTVLSNDELLTVTPDQLEELLLDRRSGSFHSRNGLDLSYTEYGPIRNANWDILVRMNLHSVFSSMLPSVGLILLGIIAVMIVLFYFVNRDARQRAKSTENMVRSIEELKKKIYRNQELADQIDYENIIQISGKGLNDELTGTSTRTIFLGQAERLLKDKNNGQILALCFIDLDDLKILNDTYGHLTGDIALKRVGSLLREYAAKFDGLVGRYGGDEFILVLCDLDSADELDTVLQELVDKLKFTVPYKEEEIAIHCSIGASLWRENIKLDTLILNADKALYDVKRHGKAHYSIFLHGDHNEAK